MNKALKVLLLSNGLVQLAGTMIGPIYALFVEEIGGGILEASWAVAVFALVNSGMMYVFSKFADKMRESELAVAGGYLMMGLSYAGYWWVDSMAGLLMVQAAIGAGMAVYTPAFDGIYSIHLDKEKEAQQWGYWEIMYALVTAGGAIVGGLVANFLGFKSLFLVMSALCLVAAVMVYRQPRKLL